MSQSRISSVCGQVSIRLNHLHYPCSLTLFLPSPQHPPSPPPLNIHNLRSLLSSPTLPSFSLLRLCHCLRLSPAVSYRLQPSLPSPTVSILCLHQLPLAARAADDPPPSPGRNPSVFAVYVWTAAGKRNGTRPAPSTHTAGDAHTRVRKYTDRRDLYTHAHTHAHTRAHTQGPTQRATSAPRGPAGLSRFVSSLRFVDAQAWLGTRTPREVLMVV